jgi:cardiolipin synthase
MLSSPPNLLTLSRILVIPAMCGAFWLPGAWGDWVPLALFIAAGVTDWLDGHLARRYGMMSDLGRFLDPVADKLLVAAAILMVVAFDRIGGISVLAAVIILCREILVTGLREFLAELRVRVPVSTLAKWKTTVQMVAIGFLVAGDAGPDWIDAPLIGEIGLWIAALLTLYTGYDYLQAGLRHVTAGAPATRAEAANSAAAAAPPGGRARSGTLG